MAKRFTGTEKWNRPWFRKLPWRYKLFWLYILDHCDIAGVWFVDFASASVCVGVKIDPGHALSCLEKQIIFINDDRWFIKDYLTFQYGSLNSKNLFHRSVLSVLQKDSVPEKFFKGLTRPSEGPAQGLNTKNKEQEIKTDISQTELPISPNLKIDLRAPRFVRPTVEMITAYCRQRKNSIDAESFFAHYESKGWRVGNSPMKNWQAAIVTWEKRNGGFSANGTSNGYQSETETLPYYKAPKESVKS